MLSFDYKIFVFKDIKLILMRVIKNHPGKTKSMLIFFYPSATRSVDGAIKKKLFLQAPPLNSFPLLSLPSFLISVDLQRFYIYLVSYFDHSVYLVSIQNELNKMKSKPVNHNVIFLHPFFILYFIFI